MEPPAEALQAIGGIATEAVWLEVIAASFYAQGLREAIEIASVSGQAFKRAQVAVNVAVNGVADQVLRKRAADWLTRSRKLVDEWRHPFLHGLIGPDLEGDWLATDMRTGQERPLDVGALNQQLDEFKDAVSEGYKIAYLIWRQRRPADSVRTGGGAR